MPGEFGRPFVDELGLIDQLVALHAAAEIGARADPFAVDDRAGRLVVHAQAELAHRKGQVGIFVVGRRVTCIETADTPEHVATDQQRGAGDIVGCAPIAKRSRITRLEAAGGPTAAVSKHQSTRFLQAAVRIDQPAAGHAAVGALGKTAQQGVQPAGGHLGIVVEKQQEFTASHRGARIAAGDEAEVVFIAQQPHASDLHQHGCTVVRRCVVDHDHLELCLRAVPHQRAQAGEGVGELAVDRDDNGNLRFFSRR